MDTLKENYFSPYLVEGEALLPGIKYENYSING